MRKLFDKEVIKGFYPQILDLGRNVSEEESAFVLKLIDLAVGFCAVLLELNRADESIEALENIRKLVRVDKVSKRMHICLLLMVTSMKI